MPVGQSLRIPGLVAVIMAGVILVSASDSVVVYIPLLGAERHIDVHDIGLLLTVRAAASMLARLFYARLVRGVRPLAADDRQHLRLRARATPRSPRRCRSGRCTRPSR